MYNNSMDQQSGHLIFIAWDMYGLEICEDLTQAEKNQLFDLIRGESNYESWLRNLVFCTQLRAQANSQRNYEIYTITLSPDLTVDDVVSAFADNPQHIVNWIRQNGNAIYRADAGHRPQRIF